MAKIAYILLCHKDPEGIIAQAQRLTAAGDFIAIAPWAWHTLEGRGTEDALLFVVDDVPTMKALGYFREERQ